MPKCILIVDDEPDLVKVTAFRLKKSGYDVLTSVDGKEALESIRNNPPDLVLLDLLLPRMSGDQVCREIKNDPKLKHIPVILFTATAVNIPDKVKEVGADDYLTKPFDPQELMEKVKRYAG